MEGYRKLIVACIAIAAITVLASLKVIEGDTAMSFITGIVGIFGGTNLIERQQINSAAKVQADLAVKLAGTPPQTGEPTK